MNPDSNQNESVRKIFFYNFFFPEMLLCLCFNNVPFGKWNGTLSVRWPPIIVGWGGKILNFYFKLLNIVTRLGQSSLIWITVFLFNVLPLTDLGKWIVMQWFYSSVLLLHTAFSSVRFFLFLEMSSPFKKNHQHIPLLLISDTLCERKKRRKKNILSHWAFVQETHLSSNLNNLAHHLVQISSFLTMSFSSLLKALLSRFNYDVLIL